MRPLLAFCRAFLRTLFGCTHSNTSWQFRDERGEYQRCNDCGKRLPVTITFSAQRRSA